MLYESDAAQISRYYEFTWPGGRWHYGLGMLPASEYLERRALWVALSELAPLEHPGLLMGGRKQPTTVARVWAGEPQIQMRDLEDTDAGEIWLSQQTLPYTARGPARTQILQTLRDEWDRLESRKVSRLRLRSELARHYGVPIEVITEPVYLATPSSEQPQGRVRALEAFASEGNLSGEEIEEALVSRYPTLYWAAHPPTELAVWRALCEWLEKAEGYVRARSLPSPDGMDWPSLFTDDNGERVLAYDLITPGYGITGELSVAPYWRERLAQLERMATALG